jgi:CBS domain containing-hemolysin-like protein
VGEVRDEFDVHEKDPITEVRPGHLIVEGSVRLDELEQYTDLDSDDYEVDSIGGLLISRLGLPIEKGNELTIGEITFRVEEVNGLTVERVAVIFPPKPDEVKGH